MIFSNLLSNIQSTDIWHDPLFQFIITILTTIFIGFLSVICTIWIYRRQNRRKQISYQILTDTPITNIGLEKTDQIDISYKGTKIENPRIVILRIWNSGNTDIMLLNKKEGSEDFNVPIRFEFNEANVINRSIMGTAPSKNVIAPEDLKNYIGEPEPEPNSVGLPRCLLKPSEAINLKIIVSGRKYKIDMKGKIVDGMIKKVATGYDSALNFSYIIGTSYMLTAIIFIVAALSTTSAFYLSSIKMPISIPLTILMLLEGTFLGMAFGISGSHVMVLARQNSVNKLILKNEREEP